MKAKKKQKKAKTKRQLSVWVVSVQGVYQPVHGDTLQMGSGEVKFEQQLSKACEVK